MLEEDFSNVNAFQSSFVMEDGYGNFLYPGGNGSPRGGNGPLSSSLHASPSTSPNVSSPLMSSTPPVLSPRSARTKAIPPLALAGLGKATPRFSADPNVLAALSSPVMELEGVDSFTDSKLREKIRHAQNSYRNLEMLQTQVKQFTKTSGAFYNAGTEWVSQGNKCAQKLTDFSITESKEPEVYRQFGETLGEVVSMMQVLMEQMDALVCQNFKSMFQPKGDEKPLVPDTTDVQKALSSAQSEYDTTLRKVMTAKQNNDNEKKGNKLAQELVDSKKRLEKATKNFTEKVGQIQDSLRLKTLEQVCSYMYATHTYFLQGHRLLSSLEPTMRQLMNDIEQEKKDMKWKASTTRDFSDHRISLRIEGSLIAGRAKQGYLFKKSKSSLKGWLIRWVVVANRQLYWYKKWKNFNHSDFIDLSSARVVEDPTHRFSFSIITPKRTLQLKTNGDKEYNEWMVVLRKACPVHLANPNPTPRQGPPSPSSSSSTSSTVMGSLPATSTSLQANDQPAVSTPRGKSNSLGNNNTQIDFVFNQQVMILSACSSNSICADCSAPEPTWLCIGAGVIVCADCAAIHKDLRPLHSVKSISEELASEEIQLMLMSGNKMANDFFECNIPADVARPNRADSKATKYDYIKRKYLNGEYLPVVDFDEDQLCTKLHEAIEKGDISKIIQLVSYGGDVNSVNTEDGEKSLIHYAVLKKHVLVVCLLLSLGAEMNVQDAQGQTPLHYAVINDLHEHGKLLIRRGASIDMIDSDGRTPVLIAHEKKISWFLETTKEVMGLARLDENDALYSRISKAAKRLSLHKALRRGIVHSSLAASNQSNISHRSSSNADTTLEFVPTSIGVSPRARAATDFEKVKSASFTSAGNPPAIPIPALSSLGPNSPKKKWRTSIITPLNLPKGEQQMTYSPRPRTASIFVSSPLSISSPLSLSSPLVSSPLSSPIRPDILISCDDTFYETPKSPPGSHKSSTPMRANSEGSIIESKPTEFTEVQLDLSNVSVRVTSSNSSPQIVGAQPRERGTSVGTQEELQRANSSMQREKGRGLTFSGQINAANQGLGSPRERRVTLLVSETPGLSREKSSTLPKDKIEKRPSQSVTPRKEKLFREESLVDIEL